MGNSLQDQLLKAGLVNEQQLKEARTTKRKSAKQPGQRAEAQVAKREAATRAREEKLARDRELDRQRQEAAAQRAAENDRRQLIHAHRIVRDGGDIAFHFTDGSKLKRIYMRQDQHAQLVAGALAIVRQDTFYELVPAAIAERLAARDPEWVLVLNRPERQDSQDDPYAAYQVPDDLMW